MAGRTQTPQDPAPGDSSVLGGAAAGQGQTLYLHQVLEAKLLGPAGLVVSLGSEFIDNADTGQGGTAEQRKQDCKLKALQRLLPRIKEDYPQLPFVLALDALYACGTVFALLKDLDWSFVVTFKEGRLPTLWR